MNLSRSGLTAQDRLIFALDVGSPAEARELVTELRPAVSFFKVGLQLFIAAGPEIVRWLTSQGLDVFLDLKIHDISETVRRSVAEATRLGARFLTIHGGGATAKAAREGRGDSHLRILSVTLLTSHDEGDLPDSVQVGPGKRFETLEDYVVWRADQVLRDGADGLVTSGQNAEKLRQKLGADPILVCPGIRAQEDRVDEQKRAVTAHTAISSGADYLVVGRPIRDAGNRVEKARQIISEIDSALQVRVSSEQWKSDGLQPSVRNPIRAVHG